MSNLHNRPKIVGLTGGIGSGKTTVANMFASHGISVYNADQSAKRLMQNDAELRRKLQGLLGSRTYDKHGHLNRAWVANQLFGNHMLLSQWNKIVHPRVAQDFEHWVNKQTGAYVIKEAAILFETNGHKNCDLSILVTAPEEDRINRVMQRDTINRPQVEERLKHQWADEKKIPLADFVINNSDLTSLSQKVYDLYVLLSKRYAQG